MSKDFDSLLEYKKSTGDWHYNPMIKSTDYQYVGRFVTDFSQHMRDVEWGEPETAIDIWEEDKDKPMDVHNLAWGKQQHIDAGYTKHNTKKYQLFNSDKVPDIFNKMADMSGLDNYSVALFRQNPGQINPWHFDTYQGVVNEYKKQGIELLDSEIKNIKRYLIVLEDWDWGHFLQIGNNVLSQWKAGDIFTWDYGMYHTTGNAGLTPKLTAHITGLPSENALHLKGEFEFNV